MMIMHEISKLETLLSRYPILEPCRESIAKAADMLINCYKQGGKVLACGNGGSAADAAHIAGELLKGFMSKRPLSEQEKKGYENHGSLGAMMAQKLQGSLPAVDLGSSPSIQSAVLNDTDPLLIYAQQVQGLADKGDVLIGISTSGNAQNVLCAGIAANEKGAYSLALVGGNGGEMAKHFDLAIVVPSDCTPYVQELHLPVYHYLCAAVEAALMP